MIKKQTITAIVCGVLAIILAVVYFLTVVPALAPKEEKVTPIELIDPLEVRTSDQTRVYMFPPLERARITRIEVQNKEGGYTFYKEKDGDFYIEGMESAPYDLYALAALVTTTGSGIATTRYLIDENTDLSVYGLADTDEDRGCYILTDDRKNTHKVWVGKEAPSGDGFYCRYDGRPAVYLMKTTGYGVLYTDVYGLMTPNLGLTVAQTDYNYVTLIGAVKNGATLFETKTLTPEENGTNKTDSPIYSFEFTSKELSNFQVNDAQRSIYIGSLSGLAGSKAVAQGAEITTERLKTEFKIDIDPKNTHFCVYYHYQAPESKNVEKAYIYISEPDKNGICYAYSSVYNIVVEIPLTSVSFYNYNVSDFIMPNITLDSISTVSKIEISGKLPDEGIDVDSAYGIKSTVVDSETGKTEQSVWNIKTNETYTADEVKNFRQIYGDIVNIHVIGEYDRENVTDPKHIATITITLTDGTVKKFDFYAYTSTRCYYTLNGELSEHYSFYVSRDTVEKVLRDTDYFNRGLTIDPNI
ncbi:MAG: DUF4340 domain-containing protein [Clostridia bacterium]|nr:DUF4340 domain-containing protein [Clostridia bacterium]